MNHHTEPDQNGDRRVVEAVRSRDPQTSARSTIIQITVDDREPEDAVAACLRRCPDADLVMQRLPVGDYLLDDALLFERKTLPDLVQSIQDGRLFRQALRLSKSPLRTAIILEGSGRDLADCGMRREAIQGALTMLTLQMGLPVLRSLDCDETATLMLNAARQRLAQIAGNLPRHGRRPRGKARLQSHILQGLPGVGPGRASRLIERFGSVQAVVAAPAEQLAEVPGIGEATARAIRWAVEEPPAPRYCERGSQGTATGEQTCTLPKMSD